MCETRRKKKYSQEPRNTFHSAVLEEDEKGDVALPISLVSLLLFVILWKLVNIAGFFPFW